MENNSLKDVTSRMYSAFNAGTEKNIQGTDLLGYVDQEVRPYLLEHYSTSEGLDSLWKEITIPILTNMSRGQDAITAFRNLYSQFPSEDLDRWRGYIFSRE